jgi:anti-sigma factor RsiW
VNCARLYQVLDAHIDGELDRATTGEITTHLAECTACAAFRDQRIALRQDLHAHAPYFKAPAALAPALRRALVRSESAAKPRTAGLSWLHVAAFATVAALAGLIGGYWLAQPLPDYPLRDPAVASHVAALAPKRQLIEIASSDRHAVKPWFQGRIDFAPPVKDLTGEGFALLGARLDQVADKPAAAVVYRIREHVVNLFVWRATDRMPSAIVTSSVRGFSVATWAADGLRFAAVSDVEERELTRFAQLVGVPSGVGPPQDIDPERVRPLKGRP